MFKKIIIHFEDYNDDKILNKDVDVNYNKHEDSKEKNINDRKHKDFVMNISNTNICIQNVGKKFDSIFLKVFDFRNYEKSFFDIRNYSDVELDACREYVDLLNSGKITEITSQEKERIIQKALELKEKLEAEGVDVYDNNEVTEYLSRNINKKSYNIKINEQILQQRRTETSIIDLSNDIQEDELSEKVYEKLYNDMIKQNTDK